jgi:hypothetical protein
MVVEIFLLRLESMARVAAATSDSDCATALRPAHGAACLGSAVSLQITAAIGAGRGAG